MFRPEQQSRGKNAISLYKHILHVSRASSSDIKRVKTWTSDIYKYYGKDRWGLVPPLPRACLRWATGVDIVT